jgi:hypothetical protein
VDDSTLVSGLEHVSSFSVFNEKECTQQQGFGCEKCTFHPVNSKDLADSAVLQVIFMSLNITQKKAKETLGHHLKRS